VRPEVTWLGEHPTGNAPSQDGGRRCLRCGTRDVHLLRCGRGLIVHVAAVTDAHSAGEEWEGTPYTPGAVAAASKHWRGRGYVVAAPPEAGHVTYRPCPVCNMAALEAGLFGCYPLIMGGVAAVAPAPLSTLYGLLRDGAHGGQPAIPPRCVPHGRLWCVCCARDGHTSLTWCACMRERIGAAVPCCAVCAWEQAQAAIRERYIGAAAGAPGVHGAQAAEGALQRIAAADPAVGAALGEPRTERTYRMCGCLTANLLPGEERCPACVQAQAALAPWVPQADA
jgi:hypothetical protein